MKKIYESFEHEQSNLGDAHVLIYFKDIDGYKISWEPSVEKLIIGDKDDLFRYLAGERKHLYENFDPNKHTISLAVNRPESMIEHGIPFSLFNHENVKNNEIKHGIYYFKHSMMHGAYLKKLNIDSDTYIDFRQNTKNKIKEQINAFFNEESKYKQEGIRHRSALLLYGPPGNGKTREIINVLQNYDKEEYICIIINTHADRLEDLVDFKPYLKGKKIIFVIEELTERLHAAESLLSFLDGENSWNNSFIIATTNHPEKLPSNIIDRPGRFSELIEFPNPTHEEKKIFLKLKGLDDNEINEIVNETKDLSLDYLVQILIQSKIKNINAIDYIKEIKNIKNKIDLSFKKNRIGFDND